MCCLTFKCFFNQSLNLYLHLLIGKLERKMNSNRSISHVMDQKLIHIGAVKSIRLPAKIAAYLVSIGRLLWLAFLYIWHFLDKISLDWPLTLTSQPSMSNLSDNPAILLESAHLRLCHPLRLLLFFFCFMFISIQYYTQNQKQKKNYLR